MHAKLFTITVFLFTIFSVYSQAVQSLPTSHRGFIENKGQITDQFGIKNDDVLYLLPFPGINTHIKKNGFSYDVYELNAREVKNEDRLTLSESGLTPEYALKYKFHRVDVEFQNINDNFKIIPLDKLSDYCNFYQNLNSVTNVAAYSKILYQEIYDNIDILFSVPSDKSKPVEYNFIIRPGGDVASIQFRITGAKSRLEANELKMRLRFGDLEESIPSSWIEKATTRQDINIYFKKIANNIYGFETPTKICNETIIIDPVPIRLWGTYCGGENFAASGAITSDPDNNIYVSGTTGSSTNIATTGTHQSTYNSQSRGFIIKFNPEGVRLWGTYYAVAPRKLRIDSEFNVVFLANVLDPKPNMTSANAFQPSKDSYTDIVLVKLNSLGIREWGTYYGGNGNDYAYSLDVDSNDNIYLGGESSSTQSVATAGAHQEINGGSITNDGLLLKFSPAGQRIWGTYYPDGGFFAIGISNDFIYAAGVTSSSTGIATNGAFQTVYGGQSDGMIVKFDLNGSRIWGTYLGTSATDYILDGKIEQNSFYLRGRTTSTSDISTPGTFLEDYQPDDNGTSHFLINFDVSTQQKVWGTYFYNQIVGLDVTPAHEVFFSGETSLDSGITTSDAYMPIKGFYNKSFLIKLNASGQRIWGTYYGGNMAEQLGTVKVDTAGDIYLYGNTNGSTEGISTPNAHQAELGQNIQSTYVAKFRDCQSSGNITGLTTICEGGTLELSAQGGDAYLWSGPNNFISTDQNIEITSVTNVHSGLYSCTISGTAGCNSTILANVEIGNTTPPVPDNFSLPAVIGVCSLIVDIIPTAIDLCTGTSIEGTTSNPLSYSVTGNYTITWSYADSNGNVTTQNQLITVLDSNTITYNLNINKVFCLHEPVFNLNSLQTDITSDNATFQFYHTFNDALAGEALIENIENYILSNGEQIFSKVLLSNGCTIISHIVFQSVEILSQNVDLYHCSTSNFGSFNLNSASVMLNPEEQYSISYFQSQEDRINNAPITSVNNYQNLTNPQTIYVTLTNDLGCISYSTINLNVQQSSHFILSDFSKCKNSGTTIFDLSEKLSEIYSQAPSDSYQISYYDTLEDAVEGTENTVPEQYMLSSGSQWIFIRIITGMQCPIIFKVKLTVIDMLDIVLHEQYSMCQGQSIILNALEENAQNYLYLWSTGETTNRVTISSSGDYWVKVINIGEDYLCETTKTFHVNVDTVPVIEDIVINDFNDNNMVTVVMQGTGHHEYSLDGINFQVENTFQHLAAGIYSVYVRSNACGLTKGEFNILDYPKFFTPNNDGINDFWRIDYLHYEETTRVYIFDRFGKLLYSMRHNSLGWDGEYNGVKMPSTDYWFIVESTSRRRFAGHFSLIR